MTTESTTDTKDDEKNPITIKVMVLAFFGVLAVFLIIGFAPLTMAKLWLSKDAIPNDAGLIGDSFGMVNSMFSGLAFAGVIITLIMQKFKLELQRKELKEAREQYERSATAQEKSEGQLHRQVDLMFVSSYLALLDMRIQAEKNQEDVMGRPIKVIGEGMNELQTRIIMDRLKRENEKALSNLTEGFDAYAVDNLYKKYMETRRYTRTLTRLFEDGIIEHDATAKADGQAILSLVSELAKQSKDLMMFAGGSGYEELHNVLFAVRLHAKKVLEYADNKVIDKSSLGELLKFIHERIRVIGEELSYYKNKLAPWGPLWGPIGCSLQQVRTANPTSGTYSAILALILPTNCG